MQAAQQTAPSRRPLDPNVAGRKVLFVAPTSCGELQIARYFWEFYRPVTHSGAFATLESKGISDWLNRSMEDYGIELSEKQIPSVFVLSTTCKAFDSIVSLTGFNNLGSVSPFAKTLNILFGTSPKRICWDIPPFEALPANTGDPLEQAIALRDRIEFEVMQFAQSIEDI